MIAWSDKYRSWDYTTDPRCPECDWDSSYDSYSTTISYAPVDGALQIVGELISLEGPYEDIEPPECFDPEWDEVWETRPPRCDVLRQVIPRARSPPVSYVKVFLKHAWEESVPAGSPKFFIEEKRYVVVHEARICVDCGRSE